MNALPDRGYLVIGSGMKSLHNDEREKTMNSYFAKAAYGDIVQSPISFKSPEKTLDRASPIVESLPFFVACQGSSHSQVGG